MFILSRLFYYLKFILLLFYFVLLFCDMFIHVKKEFTSSKKKILVCLSAFVNSGMCAEGDRGG